MSKLIVLPNGNAISPEVIKAVQLSKSGVACYDTQRRLAAWIEAPDEERGRRIRDIMIGLANDGARVRQPDWSFLEGEAK